MTTQKLPVSVKKKKKEEAYNSHEQPRVIRHDSSYLGTRNQDLVKAIRVPHFPWLHGTLQYSVYLTVINRVNTEVLQWMLYTYRVSFY